MIGAKGGPGKYGVEEIQRWSEGGYMCGYKVPGDKFYVQRKYFCGNYVESQYYNHLGGKKVKDINKGGSLAMRNICAICYSFHYVFSDDEIKRSCIIGGKNYLLIFRDIFNSNIKIMTSGGYSNSSERQGKRGSAKTRKIQVASQRSNNKYRK